MQGVDSLLEMGFTKECVFRYEEDGKYRCRIQSLPSIYSITPEVCSSCSIPESPCRYLKAKVLVGEDISGRPRAMVIKARCTFKNIDLDPREFRACKGCEFYRPFEEKLRDGLTGLYRREVFDKRLEEEMRRGGNLSLLMIDIDHFKNINDEFGHQQGDMVLRMIGEIVEKTIGKKGESFRYGGEEISVILPGLGIPEARALSEELRERIERASPPKYNKSFRDFKVTVSIGIGIAPPAEGPESLIEQADRALYRAKEEGRNRVCVYEEGKEERDFIQLEVDFMGDAVITRNSRVKLEEYYTYPSNKRKLRAVKVYDFQQGVISIGEVDPLIGRPPLKKPLEGKVIEVTKGKNRTQFLIKVSEKRFEEIFVRRK